MTAITHHRFIIDRLREAIDKFDCYLSARDLKNRKENISDPTKLIGLETYRDMARNEQQGAKSRPRKRHNSAVTMNIKQTTIPVSKYHPSTKVVSFHVEKRGGGGKTREKEKKK